MRIARSDRTSAFYPTPAIDSAATELRYHKVISQLLYSLPLATALQHR
jgi:16S rRNA A1518/A1519 N6-dimethyltransferase RsmA/KsgA/DIM1 with predicted DNA glycosylase/AP lyase activity